MVHFFSMGRQGFTETFPKGEGSRYLARERASQYLGTTHSFTIDRWRPSMIVNIDSPCCLHAALPPPVPYGQTGLCDALFSASGFVSGRAEGCKSRAIDYKADRPTPSDLRCNVEGWYFVHTYITMYTGLQAAQNGGLARLGWPPSTPAHASHARALLAYCVSSGGISHRALAFSLFPPGCAVPPPTNRSTHSRTLLVLKSCGWLVLAESSCRLV